MSGGRAEHRLRWRRRRHSALRWLFASFACLTLCTACVAHTPLARANNVHRDRFVEWQNRSLVVAVEPSGDSVADQLLRVTLEETWLFHDVVIDERGDARTDLRARVLATGPDLSSEPGPSRVSLARISIRAAGAVLLVADGGVSAERGVGPDEERMRVSDWLAIELVESELHHRLIHPNGP